MKERQVTPQQQVVDYFNTWESRLGYRLLLHGAKHFGYYPEDRAHLSTAEALQLMEDQLGEKLNLSRNALMLDAGCGEGGPALHLAKYFGLRVRGIDLMNSSVEAAQRKAKDLGLADRVEFQSGDYTELPHQNETFDGVYTMETLVHVPDSGKALRGFHRVLKRGGRLVLFEYSLLPRKKMTTRQRTTADLIIEESAMHSLPSFTHGQFPKILSQAGFHEIAVENITPRILPMLRRFYTLADFPYQLIRHFGLQRRFVNATFAVEWYRDIVEKDLWRYNMISASKPG